jgi:hypothetical protein
MNLIFPRNGGEYIPFFNASKIGKYVSLIHMR